MKVGTNPFPKVTKNIINFQWSLGNGSAQKKDWRHPKVKMDV